MTSKHNFSTTAKLHRRCCRRAVGYTMDSLYFSWLEKPVDVDAELQLPHFTLRETILYDCSQNYTSGQWRSDYCRHDVTTCSLDKRRRTRSGSPGGGRLTDMIAFFIRVRAKRPVWSLVNPLKGRAVNWLYTLPSRSNLHFLFLTFGHSGAQPWAPECPNVRN